MKNVLFLLLILIISCKSEFNPNASYSKKTIDEKYPYFNIGVSSFGVQKGKDYVEFSVEEKKFVLENLAIMRLIVHTEEFEKAMFKNQEGFVSDRTVVASKAGEYGCEYGKSLEINRLLYIIRHTSYDVEYIKGQQWDYAATSVGEFFYSYLGTKKVKPTTYVSLPRQNLIKWVGGDRMAVMAVTFHEHMHNIGFAHWAKPDILYKLQGVIQSLGYEMNAKLFKAKYKKEYEELVNYYLEKYKHLLDEPSIAYPNSK